MVGAKSRKEPEQEIGFSSQGREEGEEGGREGGGRGREGGGRAIQCPWPDGSRTQKLPVRSWENIPNWGVTTKSAPVFWAAFANRPPPPHYMNLKHWLPLSWKAYILNDLLGILFGNFFTVGIQQYLLLGFLPTGLFFFILEEDQKDSQARTLTSTFYD